MKKYNSKNSKNRFNSQQDKPIVADYISTKTTVHNRVSKFSELRKHTQKFSDYLFEMSDLNAVYETELKYDFAMKERHKRYLTYANKLDNCATYLKFRNYYKIEKVKLLEMFSCQQHLLCPFCSSARATRLIQSYHRKVQQVLKEKGKSKYKVVMITLTVKSNDDLLLVMGHLLKSLKKYVQRRKDFLTRNKGKFNEFCKIDGAVWSLEITKTEQGYHPHLHMIAIISDYIEQSKMSDEWFDITNDSSIVDVRLVRSTKDKNGKRDFSKGFCEAFKYALKFNEMDFDTIWEIHELLSKQKRKPRLTGAFGSLHGVEVDETDPDSADGSNEDDKEDIIEDADYFDLYYRYINHCGYDLVDILPPDNDSNTDDNET